MSKIEPKRLNKQPVEWELSELARNTVKHFSEYSERSEEAIVGRLIVGLLEDEDFVEWVRNKKNNKRVLKELGLKPNDDI